MTFCFFLIKSLKITILKTMILNKKNKVLVKFLIKENETIIMGDKIRKYEIDFYDNNDLSNIIYSILKNKEIGFSGKFKVDKLDSEIENIELFNLFDYPEAALYKKDEIIIFGVEKKRIGRVLEMNNETLKVDFSNPIRKNNITIEIKFINILKEGN